MLPMNRKEGSNPKPSKNVRIAFAVTDGAAGLLHLTSGIAMLALSLTIADVKLQTYFPFQSFTEVGDAVAVEWKLREGPGVWPGVALGIMELITAFQHFASIALINIQWKGIMRGFNWLIWPEYALTSAIMLVVIGWLLGVLTYGNSLLLGGFMFLTNMIGFAIEWNIYSDGHPKPLTVKCLRVVWFPFLLGSVATLLPWVNLWVYFGLSYAEAEENPPWWVTAGFLSTFVTFISFAVNFVLQRISQGFNTGCNKKYPWIFRYVYIILSLVSKLSLAWFFMGGVLSRTVE